MCVTPHVKPVCHHVFQFISVNHTYCWRHLYPWLYHFSSTNCRGIQLGAETLRVCKVKQETHGSRATRPHLLYSVTFNGNSHDIAYQNSSMISVTWHNTVIFTVVQSHTLWYQVHDVRDVSGDHCLLAGCGSGWINNLLVARVCCLYYSAADFSFKLLYL